MNPTLRELLDNAVTDGTARLPIESDPDYEVPLTLEMVVQLWAFHRTQRREEQGVPRVPERIIVTAESGDETRAILRIAGSRYRVDAAGRVALLCTLERCSQEAISHGLLEVCESHFDAPEMTGGQPYDDPEGLHRSRTHSLEKLAASLGDRAENLSGLASYHRDIITDAPSRPEIPTASRPAELTV
ncbi:hypothetical protein ACWEO1_36285 [Kitasatospora cineracea]